MLCPLGIWKPSIGKDHLLSGIALIRINAEFVGPFLP